jgi:hypothetical protein
VRQSEPKSQVQCSVRMAGGHSCLPIKAFKGKQPGCSACERGQQGQAMNEAVAHAGVFCRKPLPSSFCWLLLFSALSLWALCLYNGSWSLAASDCFQRRFLSATAQSHVLWGCSMTRETRWRLCLYTNKILQAWSFIHSLPGLGDATQPSFLIFNSN